MCLVHDAWMKAAAGQRAVPLFEAPLRDNQPIKSLSITKIKSQGQCLYLPLPAILHNLLTMFILTSFSWRRQSIMIHLRPTHCLKESLANHKKQSLIQLLNLVHALHSGQTFFPCTLIAFLWNIKLSMEMPGGVQNYCVILYSSQIEKTNKQKT